MFLLWITGHKANDRRCPARGKQCRKCNESGHFLACVKLRRSKPVVEELEGRVNQTSERREVQLNHVRQVETASTQDDDCEYALGILDDSSVLSDGKISVKMGGLPVKMIIDSGASCNVIGRNVWEYLKAKKGCMCVD